MGTISSGFERWLAGVDASEGEKRLRELILERTYSDSAKTQYEADLEALKAAARNAALEEAADIADSEGVSDNRTVAQRAASARAHIIAERVRALQTQPVAVVSVDRVREALTQTLAEVPRPGHGMWATGIRNAVLVIARRLGVDLDVAKEPTR